MDRSLCGSGYRALDIDTEVLTLLRDATGTPAR
jgi:hypothetical protein